MRNLLRKLVIRRARKRPIVSAHELDEFYLAFEEKFRGSEHEIQDRLRIYLSRLTKAAKTGLPVLDMGSGRGELLQLLSQKKIRAEGVDLSPRMVDLSRKKGLTVFEDDALSFLVKRQSGDYAAITGVHILEHLPFATIFSLTRECLRCLTPGGYVILETPNPQNLVVGSNDFYNDPSHLHPLPPALLTFLLDYLGFIRLKTLYFRPSQQIPAGQDKQLTDIAEHLFGPTDYAVIGQKPN